MNLEQAHNYEKELENELKKIGKFPYKVYSSVWRAIEEYNKILNKSKEKEKRIESPDYPESKEEWEECGWDIDKEEQKFKSEEKGT